MKTLFDVDTQMAKSLIPQASDLFLSGLHWLSVIAKGDGEIRFPKWAKLLTRARGTRDHLSVSKLQWLWESITKEPGIRKHMGHRLVSLDEEWKRIEPTTCLPPKSSFGVFFRNLQSYSTPMLALPNKIHPDAEAAILEPLRLRPGRAHRLECCDVKANLTIRPPTIGPKNVEAAALKVPIRDIVINEGQITVSVKSLNHAYTKASLRLEPHRRSHGGRIYNHIAYRDGADLVPLGKIRQYHEELLWSKMISGG